MFCFLVRVCLGMAVQYGCVHAVALLPAKSTGLSQDVYKRLPPDLAVLPATVDGEYVLAGNDDVFILPVPPPAPVLSFAEQIEMRLLQLPPMPWEVSSIGHASSRAELVAFQQPFALVFENSEHQACPKIIPSQIKRTRHGIWPTEDSGPCWLYEKIVEEETDPLIGLPQHPMFHGLRVALNRGNKGVGRFWQLLGWKYDWAKATELHFKFGQEFVF